MNQEVRNKLRSVVTQCRKLLEDSVSQEFEGKYAIFARKDKVTADPYAPMAHLTEEEKAARKDILDHFGHIQARGFTPRDALDQLVREIAFTHLNRLCAYKMMEAREVYVGGQKFREAVSRGVNSNGVKFYLADHPEEERMFNTGHQDEAYRHFLDWLGGLLSDEIGVLFNPSDPANRLYPRQNILDEVLDLLNNGSIKPEETELREEWLKIWSQDETIGWVYQYFTPKELRDQARKESQAPRNSYELAFRNQFFTPRYVVEFLTDNTLGRIWYEMRKGDTKLKDQCRYMVRRSNEFFLEEGQQAPEAGATKQGNLSQEDLLKQRVYIPHRPKGDPRDLKILDPACGSGHFLLYCFDLLLTIYEEAYSDESLSRTLTKDYESLEELRRDVPRLILAYNVHGIDIDVRATQIAALALWLRCQRAYQDFGLKKNRPAISRSNIVCAEPMPGEEQMLKDFVGELEPKFLGQVVEVVFEKMKIAGEAGSLLKIEEEIRETVAAAKKQWARDTARATDRKGQPLLFTQAAVNRMAGMPDQPSLFDLSDITDDQFFEQAEANVIEALREYAENAQKRQRFQRKLFTEDAVRGFAFVDLCHKRFDVVLMNPPFGLPPVKVFTYLKQYYPFAYVDMYPAFLTRGQLLSPSGLIGAISSRSFLMTPRMTDLRENLLVERLLLLLDLGPKVMDDAEVESCAYVFSGQPALLPQMIAFNLRFYEAKDPSGIQDLCQNLTDCYIPYREDLKQLPGGRLFYSIPADVHSLLRCESRFEPRVGTAREGLRTFDDFRFIRARWEVPAATIGRSRVWVPYSKGGAYAKYYSDLHLLVKWENDGKELSQKNIEINGQTAQARQAYNYYFRKGGTYSQRGKAFSVRVLPADCILGCKGPAVLSESSVPVEYLIGWMNSDLICNLIHLQANKYQYNTGIVKRLPWIEPSIGDRNRVSSITRELIELSRELEGWKETDSYYLFRFTGKSIEEVTEGIQARRTQIEISMSTMMKEVDAIVERLYGISADSVKASILGNTTDDDAEGETQEEDSLEESESTSIDRVLVASGILSYSVGCLFGRWDLQLASDPQMEPRIPDPFDPIAVCSPGMLQDNDGLPLVGAPDNYPLRINWNGIYVDDPEHPDDIVRRVRDVFELIWAQRAEGIEKEIIQNLGGDTLRDIFRKPGKAGFWDDHVSRYSKSPRKAPIYWLLQSSKRNYSLWVYYPRFNKDLLFKALVNYVEPKIRLEVNQLESLRSQQASAGGSGKEAKRIANELQRQEDFISELRDFENKLRKVANLHLEPDLNDGVVLNIAPLREMVPWKEAKKYWENLLDGKYEWSSVGKQLRQKGLVK